MTSLPIGLGPSFVVCNASHKESSLEDIGKQNTDTGIYTERLQSWQNLKGVFQQCNVYFIAIAKKT